MQALIFLLFLLLPSYVIRFHIGGLPTTMLEVLIWIVIFASLVRLWRVNKINTDGDTSNIFNIHNIFNILARYRLLALGLALFLLGATISLFTSVNLRAALGEWKAFYIEPIIVFFIIITSANHSHGTHQSSKIPNSKFQIPNTILHSLILCGLATSILAIYQHYTGWGVPHAFWANRDTYRVTAWYGFPNAVGLFLAPLIPLALYTVKHAWNIHTKKTERLKDLKIANLSVFQSFNLLRLSLLCSLLFIPSALAAVFFAKSTGALVGISAGIGVLFLYNKKTRWPAVAAGLLAILVLFTLSSDSPIRQELLAQNRSGQIRQAIWRETAQLLRDRPILGAGLASYTERVRPYHQKVNGENIEIFHHPHNIFLTMWVNTGIVGLIGFLLILFWFYRTGIQNSEFRIQNNQIEIVPFVLSSMTVLLTAGLVDSPYIKNDLAILFWALPALLLLTTRRDTDIENITDTKNIGADARSKR